MQKNATKKQQQQASSPLSPPPPLTSHSSTQKIAQKWRELTAERDLFHDEFERKKRAMQRAIAERCGVVERRVLGMSAEISALYEDRKGLFRSLYRGQEKYDKLQRSVAVAAAGGGGKGNTWRPSGGGNSSAAAAVAAAAAAAAGAAPHQERRVKRAPKKAVSPGGVGTPRRGVQTRSLRSQSPQAAGGGGGTTAKFDAWYFEKVVKPQHSKQVRVRDAETGLRSTHTPTTCPYDKQPVCGRPVQAAQPAGGHPSPLVDADASDIESARRQRERERGSLWGGGGGGGDDDSYDEEDGPPKPTAAEMHEAQLLLEQMRGDVTLESEGLAAGGGGGGQTGAQTADSSAVAGGAVVPATVPSGAGGSVDSASLCEDLTTFVHVLDGF